MECRRCPTGKSYRPDVVALFTSQPERIFTRTSVFQELVASRAACSSPTHIGSLLYHLRQEDIVERTRKGTFKYCNSDAGSPDFVYAGRLPKV
jgi:hypothetical protein